MILEKPRVLIRDEYAVMECRNSKFFYGFEVTDNEDDWGFQATIRRDGQPDEIVTILASELGEGVLQFDTMECLLTGIGWILSKYELAAKEPTTPQQTKEATE